MTLNAKLEYYQFTLNNEEHHPCSDYLGTLAQMPIEYAYKSDLCMHSRGVNNYQYHFEVYLRYPAPSVCKHIRTILAAIAIHPCTYPLSISC